MTKCLIILLFYFVSLELKAQEKVVWLEEDLTHSLNLAIEHSVSISHDTSRLMLNKLNDVDFDIVSMPVIRVERYMKKNSTYCMSGRIQTKERMLTRYFSQPVHLYPSLKLYYTNKNHPLPIEAFDQKGRLISLKTLFQFLPNKYLTIESDLSYGSTLDAQIKELPTRNLNIEKGDDKYLSIANMLLKERVEFALFYPTLYSQSIVDGEQQGLLNSVSLAANDPYILGRVSCSKTALGKSVIAKVNRVLDNLYLNDEFYQRHIKFINPMDHESFKKDFHHVFNNRNF